MAVFRTLTWKSFRWKTRRGQVLLSPLSRNQRATEKRWKSKRTIKKLGQAARRSSVNEERVAILQQELAANREHLQAIIQDLEAANEELQSANEEILSSNEELQSTNEELDTAKEELQSTNEELNTVNSELHSRNDSAPHQQRPRQFASECRNCHRDG